MRKYLAESHPKTYLGIVSFLIASAFVICPLLSKNGREKAAETERYNQNLEYLIRCFSGKDGVMDLSEAQKLQRVYKEAGCPYPIQVRIEDGNLEIKFPKLTDRQINYITGNYCPQREIKLSLLDKR